MTDAKEATIAPLGVRQSVPREAHPGAYLAATVAGGLACIASIFGVFLLLDVAGRLPPPPISNNLCIDEKLAFMRDRPAVAPNVLVLGSSVAWRSVDGQSLAAVHGVHPVNGGFCGLRMNQAEFVGDWLLDRMPSVRSVVVVASPFDFVGCKVNPRAVFNRAAADEFVYGGAWRWGFYFRFFDPVSMVRNAIHLPDMRSNRDEFDPLVFTQFGDGPLTNAGQRGLVYGALPDLDPVCFGALGRLARRLSAEGRKLTVVATPLHPDWKAAFDRDGAVRGRFNAAVLAALQGTGMRYWNGDAESPMGGTEFSDALHLRWPSVRTFTRTFARALKDDLVPRGSEADGPNLPAALAQVGHEAPSEADSKPQSVR